MSDQFQPDIRAGRISAEQAAKHFADASPCLTTSQALIEAERCLYCFDAPCTQACPTGIDVPSFIRRIAEGNVRGAAHTILEANPMGGTCARVCPTEVLCEQVCVRMTQEDKPVAIGRLQRYAVDGLMKSHRPQLFNRAPETGYRVAVVGAGPAGLTCAHVLARLGHQVEIFDAKPKAGGLNEYGLAAYKVPEDHAQQELQWLLSIGGIQLQAEWRLQSLEQFSHLRQHYDAVFLGLGLDQTKRLGVPGEALWGVEDAVAFIARLRQTPDLTQLQIGRHVVVIGGGMTAIDAAVQSKLLGAEQVHLIYRRGPASMGASEAEQHWAQTRGVMIHHWLNPVEIQGQGGNACGVRFEHQTLVRGQLTGTGEWQDFAADMVLKAIGQQLGNAVLSRCGLSMEGGRIDTNDDGQTSLSGVWAGGDCRTEGLDLTVDAVEHGKRAAHDIHKHLTLDQSWSLTSSSNKSFRRG